MTNSERTTIQMQAQYLAYFTRWKAGEESGMRGQTNISSHIRKYLFEKHDSKCVECGWGQINPSTGKTPLEVDHIDGDHKNNVESNLQLLCPNCHSLTPTFKSLNNGRGRKTRYK